MTLTEFEAIQAEIQHHVDAIHKALGMETMNATITINPWSTRVHLMGPHALPLVESVTHIRRGVHRTAKINGWEVSAIAPEPEEIEVVR